MSQTPSKTGSASTPTSTSGGSPPTQLASQQTPSTQKTPSTQQTPTTTATSTTKSQTLAQPSVTKTSSKTPSNVSKTGSKTSTKKDVIITPPLVKDEDGNLIEVITKSQAKENEKKETMYRYILLILLILLLIVDMYTFWWEFDDRKLRHINQGLTVSILITMILFSISFFLIGLLASIYHNWWMECRYGIGMVFYLIFAIAWAAGYTFSMVPYPRIIQIILIAIIIPVAFLLAQITKKVYPEPWYPSACCGPYYSD